MKYMHKMDLLKLLTPNHGRTLVQDCFPPYQRNSVQWKANSAELSTLLFQTQSQGSTLVDVIQALDDMARKRDGKTGNLIIVVEILRAIVEKGSHELGLYGVKALGIIEAVLAIDDLNLVEVAAPAFEAICTRQPHSLLASDQSYFAKYSLILKRFTQFASRTLATTGARSSVWTGQKYRTTGLQVLRTVIKTESVVTDRDNQLREIVPVLLENIFPGDVSRLIRAVKGDYDREHHHRQSVVGGRKSLTISRDSEARDREVVAASGSVEDADRLGEDEVAIEAISCLRQLFEPSSSSRVQLRTTTAEIGSFIGGQIPLLGVNKVAAWANSLFSIVCSWAAVQDRFVILVRATELLKAEGEVEKATILGSVVAGMLHSDTSFVGLGVVDAMRTVLSVLTTSQNKSDKKGYRELIEQVRRCLVGFGGHIYYRGQVSDLVGSLLAKVRDDSDLTADNKILVLGTVRELLEGKLAHTPLLPQEDEHGHHRRPTIAPVSIDPVPISVWEGTDRLLTEDWPVRQAWTAAWVAWVDSQPRAPGSRDSNSLITSSPGVHVVSFNFPSASSAAPSFHHMSMSGENPLSRRRPFLETFAVSVYDFAQSAADSDHHARLAHVLLASLPRLGVHVLAHTLQMVVRLQESIMSFKSLTNRIRVGAMAHGYFLATVQAYNLGQTEVGDTITSEVGRRKEHGLWVRGIRVPTEQADSASSPPIYHTGDDINSYTSLTDGSASDAVRAQINVASLFTFDDHEGLVTALSRTTAVSPDSHVMCVTKWDRDQAAKSLTPGNGSRAASIISRQSGKRAVSGGTVSVSGGAGMLSHLGNGVIDINGASSGGGGMFPTTTVGLHRASRLMSSNTRLSALGGGGVGGTIPSGGNGAGMGGAGLGIPGMTASGATTPNRSSSSRLSLVTGVNIAGGPRYDELKRALLLRVSSTDHLPHPQSRETGPTSPYGGSVGGTIEERDNDADDVPPVPPIPESVIEGAGTSKFPTRTISTRSALVAIPSSGRNQRPSPSWSSSVRGLLQDGIGWGLDFNQGEGDDRGLPLSAAAVRTVFGEGDGPSMKGRPRSDMGPGGTGALLMDVNRSVSGAVTHIPIPGAALGPTATTTITITTPGDRRFGLPVSAGRVRPGSSMSVLGGGLIVPPY